MELSGSCVVVDVAEGEDVADTVEVMVGMLAEEDIVALMVDRSDRLTG